MKECRVREGKTYECDQGCGHVAQAGERIWYSADIDEYICEDCKKKFDKAEWYYCGEKTSEALELKYGRYFN